MGGRSRHLDDGFAYERGPKEVPEGHLSLTATDAAQIEGSIRPGRQQYDPSEPIPLHDLTAPIAAPYMASSVRPFVQIISSSVCPFLQIISSSVRPFVQISSCYVEAWQPQW